MWSAQGHGHWLPLTVSDSFIIVSLNLVTLPDLALPLLSGHPSTPSGRKVVLMGNGQKGISIVLVVCGYYRWETVRKE